MPKDIPGDDALPSNFIVYDHDHPSPLFPPERVAYIESINADFADEDLKRIRSFERFALNLNTGLVGNGGIPGLRKELGRDHIYVKRFSNEPWRKLIRYFDSYIPDVFPDKARCMIEMIRITIPNGDRFYPFTFFGDLDEWRRAMARAANDCGTVLATFRNGTFLLSDGQTYGMSQLAMAWKAPGRSIPASW